jgi:putative transposase
MLRETTRMLIARARHNNELVGKLWVAIDITKGNPWTGQVERDDDGHNVEPHILGYKGGESHFQWATIQVIGHDIPLVLDAIPVHRGFKRSDIVDELLGNALDLAGGIELVMMDREFDSDDIKDVCDDHGVYYLNPARKHASEKATCRRLHEAGRRVKVVTQEALSGGSDRKRMYLPATNYDLFATDETPEEEEEAEIRQELMDEFATIVEGDEDERSPFDDLLDDLREEEAEDEEEEDEAVSAYALFETNHPDLSPEDADSGEELLRDVRTVVRRYRHRWGIENGYKKLKKFRVRTTSKNHGYRFFNFAFACVLYNVWRIVDLLVKLAIEDDPDYAPRVDANQFLTVAKKYYGLDPPD